MSKKIFNEYFLLSIILLLAFILRLYKINTPLADWHSWRQADTSAVSRNFLKYGFNLLHPRFDDLSNIPSGKENPQGYRFVEFPFYNLVQAGAARSFPQMSLEWWGRMVSIIFSLGSLVFLYFLVKKYLSKKVGLLTAFFFAVLPYNIFYSRVILPEPMMVFTSLGMIYYFSRYLEKKEIAVNLFWLLSVILAVISLLLKPITGFLFLPMVYLVWQKQGFSGLKNRSVFFYFLISLVPLFLWRIWISQYPSGIPAYSWLFNEAGIRFKGAFFRWIFAERLGKLILGYWGLVPFAIGILLKKGKKEGWFFHWWLISVLIYFTVFAGGNVRHDYYQVIAVPIISIFLAKGADFLLRASKLFFERSVCYLLFVICLFFMLAFSWYEVRGFFNINHPEIVEAGKAVDFLLPLNAKVIAPYNGDTAFLYHTNRQGWPMMTGSLEHLIDMGATHYVSVNFDEFTQGLLNNYEVIKKTDKYIIFSLITNH